MKAWSMLAGSVADDIGEATSQQQLELVVGVHHLVRDVYAGDEGAALEVSGVD